MAARSVASTRSSASRHSTQSWLACSTQNAFWLRKPSNARWITRAPAASATAAVASAENESTTTISSQNASEARQSPIRSASLKAMMQADRRGRWEEGAEVGMQREMRGTGAKPSSDATDWRCDNPPPLPEYPGVLRMPRHYLLYGSERYALAILRPVQAAIRARGDEAAWFFDGPGAEDLAADETLLTVEQVRAWNPYAVITSSNAVPHFFPGVKVET